MTLLPKPKTYEAKVLMNLQRVKAQVADGMSQIESVKLVASEFIKSYFERIPVHQV